VQELVSVRGSGLTTESIEPTLRALSRGQVRTLIVDADAVVPGYRWSTSGRLAESATGARGEGEALPLADLLDDAIEDALRQRSRGRRGPGRGGAEVRPPRRHPAFPLH